MLISFRIYLVSLHTADTVNERIFHEMEERVRSFERDLYLVEHFQVLGKRHPNLTFTPVLSEAQSPQYRSGFVAVAEDLSELDGWKAYVAGPPPMVDAAMEVVFARGLRKEDMHADVFDTGRAAHAGHCRMMLPAAMRSRRSPPNDKGPLLTSSRRASVSFVDPDQSGFLNQKAAQSLCFTQF